MPTITDPDALLSMDLWLDVNAIGSGLTNSQNFKYALTTEPDSCTTGVISTGTFNGKTANTTVQLLDGQTYAKTVNEKYYLYIWLDAAETSNNTMNQTFNLSLNGECTNNAQIEIPDLSYTVTNLSTNTNNLDTGFYTLSSYTCDNDSTTITYDTISKKITSNGIDKCDLNFTETSNPKLYDVVEIGVYIAYTADSSNGCTGNQCSGWNANQTATDIYDNYGYCYSTNYKFYTYGWRVLHKTDNSVYIVSAGAPECVAGTSNNSTATIQSLNTNALKYCNSSYLSGGICDSTTAHAFNGDDFYKFTGQYYGDANAKYLYSYNDGGTYGSPYCYNKYSTTYCGYNNSIIDNGGYYWFGSAYSADAALSWHPSNRRVNRKSTSTNAFGLRPVLKLDSSITATGGTGTIDNPYTISERTMT